MSVTGDGFHPTKNAARGLPDGKLTALRFGILSAEQILGLSVTEANFGVAADRQRATGAINDVTLGTTTRSYECPTCQCSLLDCVGHFAYVDGWWPVPYPFFIDQLLAILPYFCPCCSQRTVHLSDTDKAKLLALKPSERIEMLKKMKRPQFCGQTNRRARDALLQEELSKAALAADKAEKAEKAEKGRKHKRSKRNAAFDPENHDDDDDDDGETRDENTEDDDMDADSESDADMVGADDNEQDNSKDEEEEEVGADNDSGADSEASECDEDGIDAVDAEESDGQDNGDHDASDGNDSDDGSRRRRRLRPSAKKKKKKSTSSSSFSSQQRKKSAGGGKKRAHESDNGVSKKTSNDKTTEPPPAKRRRGDGTIQYEGTFDIDQLATFGCGAPLPTYRRSAESDGQILAEYTLEWKGDARKSIWPKHNGWHLYRMLQNISPEDQELVGHDWRLSAVRSMMMTVMIVTPPIVRQGRDEKKNGGGGASSSSAGPGGAGGGEKSSKSSSSKSGGGLGAQQQQQSLDETTPELRELLVKQRKLLARFAKEGITTQEEVPSVGLTIFWYDAETKTRIQCTCDEHFVCRCIYEHRLRVKPVPTMMPRNLKTAPVEQLMGLVGISPTVRAFVEAEQMEYAQLKAARSARQGLEASTTVKTMLIPMPASTTKNTVHLDLLATRRIDPRLEDSFDVQRKVRIVGTELVPSKDGTCEGRNEKETDDASSAATASTVAAVPRRTAENKSWKQLLSEYQTALITYTIGEINRKGSGRKEQKTESSPWAAGAKMQNAAQKRDRCLASTWVGKKGRIRGTIYGKRLDKTARSVAAGCMYLEVDQIGIPREVADTLTVIQPVQELNRAQLMDALRSGVVPYVRNPVDVSLLSTRFLNRDTYVIQNGQSVERYLQTNDYVIFNRQPTLHKPSMQGARVKIASAPSHLRRRRAFATNQIVTEALNCDYDGDELNIYAVESWRAMTEVAMLMSAQRQIRSQQGDCLILSLVQTSKLALYRLTQPDIWLTRMQFDQCIEQFNQPKFPAFRRALFSPPPFDHPDPTQPLLSGKRLIESLLPLGVFYKAPHVCIINSRFESGSLRGTDVATRVSGNLVHCMIQQVGETLTLAWMAGIQRTLHYWLMQQGDTISPRDYELSSEQRQKCREYVKRVRKWCLNYRENYDMRRYNYAERRIQNMLETVRMCVQNELKTELVKRSKLKGSHRNGALDLILSSAKGKESNLQQLGGQVGQQMPLSGRVTGNIAHFNATMDAPEAHGYIAKSFQEGIDPSSFYAASIAGCEALVKIHAKTPNVGYLHARLQRSLADYTARIDGSTRDSRNSIVQFAYGESGFDPAQTESNPLKWLTPPDYASKQLRAQQKQCFQNIARLYTASKFFPKTYPLPFSRQRLLNEYGHLARLELAKHKPNTGMTKAGGSQTLATPEETTEKNDVDGAVRTVSGWLESMVQKHLLFPRGHLRYNLLLWTSLEDMLSEYVLKQHDLTTPATWNVLIRLLAALELHIARAYVANGDAIGPVASQAIAEPATQMTLGAFHNSGSRDTLAEPVTLLGNAINACKKRTGVGMRILLHSPWNQTQRTAKAVVNMIVERNLLFYLDSLSPTTLDEDLDDPRDREWVERALIRRGPTVKYIMSTRPTFRLVFHTQRCRDADLGMVELMSVFLRHPKHVFLQIHNGASPLLDPVCQQNQRMVAYVTFCEGAKTVKQRKSMERDLQTMVLEHEKSTRETKQNRQRESRALATFTKADTLLREILRETLVRGIPRITSAKPVLIARKFYDEARDMFEIKEEWGIDTQGSNLEGLSNLPCANLEECTTSFIHDVQKVIGIVGVKRWLKITLEELVRTYGSRVDLCHIDVIGSVETRKGFPTPINRYGLRNSTESSLPLLFENAPEYLRQFSASAVKDPLVGVPECLLMGNPAPIGTGVVQTRPASQPSQAEQTSSQSSQFFQSSQTLQAIQTPQAMWSSFSVAPTFENGTIKIKLPPHDDPPFEIRFATRKIPCEAKPFRFFQQYVDVNHKGEFFSSRLVASFPDLTAENSVPVVDGTIQQSVARWDGETGTDDSTIGNDPPIWTPKGGAQLVESEERTQHPATGLSPLLVRKLTGFFDGGFSLAVSLLDLSLFPLLFPIGTTK